MKILLSVFLAALTCGCSTWGHKVPMGDHRYPRVPREHVVILFEAPKRPYEQIGIVSSLGGLFASDGDMFKKMQMAGADMGADAIIVRSDAPQIVGGPGNTFVQTQTTKAYWDYPRTSAIAIKYR